eukprot:1147723-Pelagomonas_calceolata.AAC.2
MPKVKDKSRVFPKQCWLQDVLSSCKPTALRLCGRRACSQTHTHTRARIHTHARHTHTHTQGTPNKVHENFDNIVALLDSNSNQGRVQQLRTEFEEYIYNM